MTEQKQQSIYPMNFPTISINNIMQDVGNTVKTVGDTVKNVAHVIGDGVKIADNYTNDILRAQAEHIKKQLDENPFYNEEEIAKMIEKAAKQGKPYIVIEKSGLKESMVEKLTAKKIKISKSTEDEIEQSDFQQTNKCCLGWKNNAFEGWTLNFSLM